MKVQDIRKTTVFQAPIQKVWNAVATAEGISSWFMPNDFQQEVGSTFTIQSPFGPSPCKVLELEPPHRLVFSWGTDGWVVTFELKELEEKTEFTLVHSGWGDTEEVIPLANETHQVIRDRMNGGWGPLVDVKLRGVVEA